MSRWSIPLDRLARAAGVKLETVARKATFDVFRAVVLRSPVDTGRFKGNWNVSFAAPNYSVGGRTDDTPLQTINATSESLLRQTLTLPVGGVTYLSNGLPYAARLEFDSYSRQAPAGMVRVSAAEFSNAVARATR